MGVQVKLILGDFIHDRHGIQHEFIEKFHFKIRELTLEIDPADRKTSSSQQTMEIGWKKGRKTGRAV